MIKSGYLRPDVVRTENLMFYLKHKDSLFIYSVDMPNHPDGNTFLLEEYRFRNRRREIVGKLIFSFRLNMLLITLPLNENLPDEFVEDGRIIFGDGRVLYWDNCDDYNDINLVPDTDNRRIYMVRDAISMIEKYYYKKFHSKLSNLF